MGYSLLYAGLAQLAEACDSKSYQCRFESCVPHHFSAASPKAEASGLNPDKCSFESSAADHSKAPAMTRRTFLATLCLLSGIHTLIADEPPPIRIVISPRAQIAPIHGTGKVKVRVVVPPNAQNRHIRVELDGETYRAWEQDWVGEAGSQPREWAISGLLPGSYEGRAILVRVDAEGRRRQFLDTFPFEVLGG